MFIKADYKHSSSPYYRQFYYKYGRKIREEEKRKLSAQGHYPLYNSLLFEFERPRSSMYSSAPNNSLSISFTNDFNTNSDPLHTRQEYTVLACKYF